MSEFKKSIGLTYLVCLGIIFAFLLCFFAFKRRFKIKISVKNTVLAVLTSISSLIIFEVIHMNNFFKVWDYNLCLWSLWCFAIGAVIYIFVDYGIAVITIPFWIGSLLSLVEGFYFLSNNIDKETAFDYMQEDYDWEIFSADRVRVYLILAVIICIAMCVVFKHVLKLHSIQYFLYSVCLSASMVYIGDIFESFIFSIIVCLLFTVLFIRAEKKMKDNVIQCSKSTIILLCILVLYGFTKYYDDLKYLKFGFGFLIR